MSQKTHYHKLRDRLIEKHKEVQKNLWTRHTSSLIDFVNNTKQLAVGSAGAAMLLTSPHTPLLMPPHADAVQQVGVNLDPQLFFISDIQKIVPDEVRPLTSEEEASVSAVLSRELGVKVVSEIDGKRLDRSYGYIGAEQHLARFPGDSMATHFSDPQDSEKYYSSGMAPGLGAWGYFAQSNESEEEYTNREKYYIAVQTFLSKDFHTRFSEYRDFYKFRKMLLVNPNNGKAIVTVVGDAGPAPWTGKHLGGSPEVMKYLERVDGRAKGPVIYMFVDDPENRVPLGPIEIKAS